MESCSMSLKFQFCEMTVLEVCVQHSMSLYITLLYYTLKLFLIFLFFLCLGETETECEHGRYRERRGQRI